MQFRFNFENNLSKVTKNVNIATAIITTVFVTYNVQPVQALSARSDSMIYEIMLKKSGNQTFSGVIGIDFVVNCPVLLTELGAFDHLSNGIAKQLTTEIWLRNDKDTPNNFFDDQGIKKLASVVFTNQEPGYLEGGSRFKPLSTPLILMPGNYTIVSYGYGDIDKNGNIAKDALQRKINEQGGFISFVGSLRYGGVLSDSIEKKIDGRPVDYYAAGTFKYTAVPENLASNPNLDKDNKSDKLKRSSEPICYAAATQHADAAAGGGGGGGGGGGAASIGRSSSDLPLILGGTAALGLGLSTLGNDNGVSSRNFTNFPTEIVPNHGSVNNPKIEVPNSSPVPEPLSMLGTGVAGILGIWMKRKQAKTKA